MPENGGLAMITQMHTNEMLFKKCGITNRKPGLTQESGSSGRHLSWDENTAPTSIDELAAYNHTFN